MGPTVGGVFAGVVEVRVDEDRDGTDAADRVVEDEVEVRVVEDEVEVLIGLTIGATVDLVFGSSIWGGVHSGGALVGRRVLGVCEKCGAVQAGVAYGFTKTEAVTVTVTV